MRAAAFGLPLLLSALASCDAGRTAARSTTTDLEAPPAPQPSAPAAPPESAQAAVATAPARGGPSARSIRAPGRAVFATRPGWVGARWNDLSFPAGTSDAVWISVDPKTLAIERGTAAAGPDQRPARLIQRAQGPRHTCSAYETGRSGFTVACAVRDGAFRIASTDFDDAKQAFPVVSTPAGHVAVFDLSLDTGDTRSAALAYVVNDTGVVVRAEASQLAGEIEPSLALVAAARAQTVARRRRMTWHHHPHFLEDF